eukprot:4075719-Amphidinium_carterae.2
MEKGGRAAAWGLAAIAYVSAGLYRVSTDQQGVYWACRGRLSTKNSQKTGNPSVHMEPHVIRAFGFRARGWWLLVAQVPPLPEMAA